MAERTRRAFVCGHPIAHSRSPLIHGYWLERYGIAGSYEAIDVLPNRLPEFLRSLDSQGLVGGNVTIPHKEAAFKAAARLVGAAPAIGAVNTLWLEDGVLCGDNTDAYGFAANLDEAAPGWSTHAVAVVLGAGGAARAILYALKERGFEDIRVVNRTLSRAEELAAEFGEGISAHGEASLPELLAGTGLLVNTTPAGMDGKPGPAIDLAPLPENAVVTDIVYAPLETPLLAAARRRGLTAVDGLGMLLHQAVPGFERWFGVRPEVTGDLRARIVADLERRR